MTAFSFGMDRQRKSNPINRKQQEAEMQREIPIASVVKKTTNAPEELLEMCGNELEAVQLCIQLSKLPNKKLKSELGIDPGHWTRIMDGVAHFPTAKLCHLQRLCGNAALLQYMAKELGFTVYEDAKAKRKAELEAELRSLAA
jgi:hypothetical protein